ncbi:fimbrial biogenesis chaperone [Citrobacter farmeri]|uniref:fimbrial biogenesis chaperone n=1 Tax=Citrobacter amalonaticus TaxID=35703 RepID=UPI0002B613FF|nr:molecular chaperone [Citrobacter amalonaticus]EKV5654612.1 molecular chaperone [Citrobacter farmeri]
MRTLLFICLVALTLSGVQSQAVAGGIQLGRTRVIYDANKKEAALPITNDEKELPWLIQSWVTNTDGNSRGPFIITPPLFRLDPQSEQNLRIMWAGTPLPTETESLYFLDIRMIPAVDKASEDKNTLRIIYKTRIKLFYRPRGLRGTPDSACQSLRFQRIGDRLQVTNNSLFYSVFDSLTLGISKVRAADMVAPKASVTLSLPSPATGQTVSWRCINDYGGPSAKYTAKLDKA